MNHTRQYQSMYNPNQRKPSSKTDDRSEREQANSALRVMKEIENDKRHLLHTVVLSNGAILSFTNEEQLKECETRYARLGVKVKRRYERE